jgi:peroxiredoxin
LLKKFREDNNFPVDMISDRGAKIAKDYNVYWFAEGWGKLKVKQAIPSKFLIDKTGKIIWKYIGKDKTDRPSVGAMIFLIDKYLNNPN